MTSESDGEALSATRGLCRLLKRDGLDPAAVVAAGLLRNAAPLSAPAAHPRPFSFNVEGEWKRRARMARGCPHLNEWELGFLRDVTEHRTLTQRQKDTLKAILAKAERGRS